MKIKINVIVVTYGHRLDYISKLVPFILSLEIHFLVIVENNVSEETASYLDEINNKKLVRLTFPINLGSAGGYKNGLSFLHHSGNDNSYIWLLDDDNLPDSGCLDTLIENIESKKHVLISNRISRSFKSNRCSENNFFGVNIFKESVSRSEIMCAPYGGLFFHMSILDIVGYPDERFFVYADDSDFTYRMYLSGIKFKFVSRALITDLGDSHNRKSKVYRYFQDEFSESLLFFQIRNHTYLSRKQKSNRLFFFSNFLIFFTFILIKLAQGSFKNSHRLIKIIKAVNAGFLMK